MNTYIIPEVSDQAQLNRNCPQCGRYAGHIHGYRHQRLIDTHVREVTKVRMRCSSCGKTWTCQPEGVKRSSQRSQRVQAMGLLLYTLGLSYRRASVFLRCIRVSSDKMTVYRDVMSSGRRAWSRLSSLRCRVSIVGIDGTGQRLAERGNPHSEGVVFVVDDSTGRLVRICLMSEDSSGEIGQLIRDLERELGVERIVTDEHGSYDQIPRECHDLCTAHFKKSKMKRLEELEKAAEQASEKKPDSSLLKRLLRDLKVLRLLLEKALHHPAFREKGGEVAKRVFERWSQARAPGKGKRATLAWTLKQLASDLWTNWDRAWHRTNNASERAIGRCLKIRSKTMRGFKVKENIIGFAALSEALLFCEGEVCLAEVV